MLQFYYNSYNLYKGNKSHATKNLTQKKNMKTNIVKNVKAGFSLVEMLVVIAVIGIIAAIAVPTIGNITDQANNSKAKRNAQNLASVCASAVAAGADLGTSTNVSSIVNQLVSPGLTGSKDSGFDSTVFKVPNLTGAERMAASQHLSYDAQAKMIVYSPK